MTYTATDVSRAQGAPAELYRFTCGTDVYRYCTLDGGAGPFTYAIAGAQETFNPAPIRRGTVEVTEEVSRNQLELTMPVSATIPKMFLTAPPDGIVGVTVYRLHLTDTDHGYVTVFKGRVLSVTFLDDEASLTCEPIFTSLRRPGLRLYYLSQCTHELYGHGCFLLRDDWYVSASVLSGVGSQLTLQGLASYADNWFAGGVFQCGQVTRMVMASAGATVTLAYAVPNAVLGQPCRLLPGCNHQRSDCHAKFNNVINYNGFDWMPLANPYKTNVFW